MDDSNKSNPDGVGDCRGFRVVYPGGHFGFVDPVLHDKDGKPTAVVAVSGLFGTRVVVIPVGEIADIDRASRRITLFDKPETAVPEHFAEVLRSHGHTSIN